MDARRRFDGSVDQAGRHGDRGTDPQPSRQDGTQHPEDELRHAFIAALLLPMSVKHARADDRQGRVAERLQRALQLPLGARVDEGRAGICSERRGQREACRAVASRMTCDGKRVVVIDRPIGGTRVGGGARRAERADDAIDGPPGSLGGHVGEVDHDVLELAGRCDRAAGQGNHPADPRVSERQFQDKRPDESGRTGDQQLRHARLLAPSSNEAE